ncbi:hypothetical protein [Sphingomicrobium arenosum]|uniref:hypothetical protein n=1 Tax=Sphingomicrobium arenosum TaxID=2233861 RepID=UPI00223F145A|nr:hypothetical protein [Sphingomicrobium arenosum]
MRLERYWPVAAIVIVGALTLLGWYALSPRLAIAQLGDGNIAPGKLTELYDRERVRSAFERQMLPQVETYPPPLTKGVILDAMSDPRAVRAFVVEPYGDWQFAAAKGLPDEFITKERADVMPRILQTSENWELRRTGFDEFVATPSGRQGQKGNSYRFERDGIGWRLVAIELTTTIR